MTYPDPSTPDGQRWAAAGFPTDAAGNPAIPAPPAAAVPVDQAAEIGKLARYTFHDTYSSPPRDRTQVVLVTGHDTDDSGQVTHLRGFALGYEDDAAAFLPSQLT